MENKGHNKSKRVKQLLLLGIFMLNFGMIFQHIRPVIKLKPLEGSFTTVNYETITFKNWFDGNYQVGADQYLNQEFGFRNLFIRLYNQIRFSFFNKTNTQSVVIGKDNYIYEYGYILAYNGQECLGEKAINDTVSQLKHLQDTLFSLGKHLLVVFAPSKVRTYPEYISDSLNHDPNRNTNYKFFKRAFENQGVNFLDFNPIFLDKKEKSSYLLFPKLGVHWSRLEAVRAYDTILKRLSYLSGKNLPNVNVESIESKNELESPDDDAINSMNLFFYPKHPDMGYPIISINKENKELSNLLVVGDSYWWDIFLRKLPKKTFKFNEFWYYNREIWGNNFFGNLKADSVDTKRHVLQNDFIVLICTESNYSRTGFGFVNRALTALRKNISMTANELTDYIDYIKSEEKWMEQIIQKANYRHISIDSMILKDADWVFQRHGPIRKKRTLDDIIASIKKNNSWFNDVKRQATEKNISMDSMIVINARWFRDNVLQVEDNESMMSIKDLSIGQIREIILHNLDWMKEITIKAKKRGISIDSMVTLDAIWFKKENSE